MSGLPDFKEFNTTFNIYELLFSFENGFFILNLEHLPKTIFSSLLYIESQLLQKAIKLANHLQKRAHLLAAP